ncbi:MAG: sigma-70 family RNA polymerase sigma factor [Clostridia bacterium]|nr:sigma-70 family RNA polymerase sigma factor [Clostridia bacterium]
MKNRHENIKNELAYFYKVIKNLDIKDSIKQSKINGHETPLDEILYNQFSVGENMDKHLEERNLLGWIELIENQKLYKAVKSLSIEDQIFISYIVKEGRTQRELSRTYGVAQKNISKRFNRVIEKIKYLLG